MKQRLHIKRPSPAAIARRFHGKERPRPSGEAAALLSGPRAIFWRPGADPFEARWQPAASASSHLLWNGGRLALLVRGDGCEGLPDAQYGWHYLHRGYVFPDAGENEVEAADIQDLLKKTSDGKFRPQPASTPEAFYADYIGHELHRAMSGARNDELAKHLKHSAIWLVVAMLAATVLLLLFGGSV